MKKNAKNMPKKYYARHMEKGVAKYDNEMLYIDDPAIKAMSPSMEGIPLIVVHSNDDKEEIIANGMQHGYVVDCFYNEADGGYWSTIMATEDKAHEAIARGWGVSNAYKPLETKGSGEWHSVPYDREVVRGAYEHLAIVPNPRYGSSCIMTPEQFKEYNERKKAELATLRNSKDKGAQTMNFFKKVKVEASDDLLDSVTVINGKEISFKDIQSIVGEAIKNEKSEADKKKEEEDKEKEMKQNMKSIIEVGGEKMTVAAMIDKFEAIQNAESTDIDKDQEKKDSGKDENEKDKKENEDGEEDEKDKDKKENAEDEDKDKKDETKKNSKDELSEEDKIQNAKNKQSFDSIWNAQGQVNTVTNDAPIETTSSMVARGKSAYGSQS